MTQRHNLLAAAAIALGACALTTMSQAQQAPGPVPDPVQNGGFEAWAKPPVVDKNGPTLSDDGLPADWTAADQKTAGAAPSSAVFKDTAVKHSGLASVRIENGAVTDTTKLSQMFPVAPSTHFVMRCWIKGENIVAAPKGGVMIWVNYGPQANFWGHQSHLGRYPKIKEGTFDWQPFEIEGTTAADSGAVNLVYTLYMASGKVWFDDVQFSADKAPDPVTTAAAAAVAAAATAPVGPTATGPVVAAVPTPIPTPVPTWATSPIKVKPAVHGLGNVWAKEARDHKLTVGYLGGSVTAGTGASKPAETSWRALTTSWFRTQFPQDQITEGNATIGGTGADFGAFRLQDDLMVKKPDLYFVEFAVNDGGKSPRLTRSLEGIVRHIWNDNPQAGIVFVYVADRGMAAKYGKGAEVAGQVANFQRVADYYGIPTVNAGKALGLQIAAGTLTMDTAFKDGVHPLDAGHASYAATVADFLKAHLADKPEGPVTLPASLSPNPMENAHLVDAWTLPAAAGWTQDKRAMAGRYPHMLTSNVPGSQLTFTFTGTAIGLDWLLGPDGGNLEWSVDGGPVQVAAAHDRYSNDSLRPYYMVLADDLPPGQHTVTFKVGADSPAGSHGTWIRIGAFMVG